MTIKITFMSQVRIEGLNMLLFRGFFLVLVMAGCGLRGEQISSHIEPIRIPQEWDYSSITVISDAAHPSGVAASIFSDPGILPEASSYVLEVGFGDLYELPVRLALVSCVQPLVRVSSRSEITFILTCGDEVERELSVRDDASVLLDGEIVGHIQRP